MSVKLTDSTDMVTCRKCGREIEKRKAVGVGFAGRLSWTCTDCVTTDSMDEVFGPIGAAIQRAVIEAQS